MLVKNTSLHLSLVRPVNRNYENTTIMPVENLTLSLMICYRLQIKHNVITTLNSERQH